MSIKPPHERSLAASNHRSLHSEQAVSYVVGFALIFSIALLSTAGLFVFGFDLLSSVDEDQAIATGQENMDIIQDELADLTTQRAASGTERLQIANAKLGFGDTSTIRINATGQTFDFSGPNALEWNTRNLIYRLPDHETEFVYSFGHVYRRYDDPSSQTLSRRSPLIDYTRDQLFVVIPTLLQHPSSPDQIATGELTERELRAEKPRPVTNSTTSIERTNRQPNGDAINMSGSITIENTTDPNAWEAAFEEIGLQNVQTVSTGAGEYRIEGEFETEQLVVQQATFLIRLL
jgi:hypothetical protein